MRGALAARLDAYLTAAAADSFCGSVLVARDGRVILAKGYGFADRERRIPFRVSTVSDIGSLTKAFTAAAVLDLEARGRLRTTDSLARFFPTAPRDKAGITIHQLLTHTAGFPAKLGEDDELVDRDAYVSRALACSLRFAPGARFLYSNVGYSLLGAVIEECSRRSYEDDLRERLFRPAGMRSTGYRRVRWDARSIAVSYRGAERRGTPLERPWRTDGPGWNLRANGGLLSTVGDLYRWHRALDGDRPLPAAATAEMFAPHVREDEDSTVAYGYGWEVRRTSRGTRLVVHNGSNGIFFADFHRYVDENVQIVFLTNDLSHAWRDGRPLSWQLATRIFASP